MKYPINAQRLREAMNDKNMKAVELSARTGVLKSSISQYLKGSHSMSNKAAGVIGEVLGVNPPWLMGFDVPKYKVEAVENSEQDKYYNNPESAQMLQDIYDNSYIHALFQAVKGSRPEDVRMVTEMLNRFKGTNPDG